MIQDALMGVIEGLVAPRRSVRRILDMKPQIETILGLVVLGYAMQAFFGVLVLDLLFDIPPLTDEDGIPQESLPPLIYHALNLVGQIVLLFLLACLVFWVGRIFGGTGQLSEALTALAWHLVVTSLLMPFFFYGSAAMVVDSQSDFPFLLLAASMAIGIWVLASFVAEVHGFESVWAVIGVMLGMSFTIGLVMALMLPTP